VPARRRGIVRFWQADISSSQAAAQCIRTPIAVSGPTAVIESDVGSAAATDDMVHLHHRPSGLCASGVIPTNPAWDTSSVRIFKARPVSAPTEGPLPAPTRGERLITEQAVGGMPIRKR
jgi:hypothetical protein